MKWFFKLERDVELDMPTAWSGFVMGDTMLEAHTAIKEKLGVDKMPNNTLVEPTIVRRSTKTTAKVKSRPKAFEDVGMTFDQAEALLKQFGLRQPIGGIFFHPWGTQTRAILAWLRKRGSDFQGRLCSVVGSWEPITFFFINK